MKFNQEAAQAGYKLAIPALEALIRTHQIPQQIGYFFDTDHPETARQLQYIKEHGVSEKWTTSFMVKLAAKAAVKNYGNHFAVNNRFFLETLLKEAKTGSLRLIGVIREAMDMEELPAPEQTEDDQQEEQEEQTEENDQPEEVVEAPPQTTSQDDVIALLRKLFEVNVMTLQRIDAIAENVIHIRDRFEIRQTKLVERVKGLDGRLDTIEEKLDIQPQAGIDQKDIEDIANIISSSVNSLNTIVRSMGEEVRQSMQTTIQNSNTDRMALVQASLTKLTGEFTALRELTLEFLPEASS